MGFKKILVPYDGSKQAEKALELACSMAKHDGAELKVLNVAEQVAVPGTATDTIFLVDQGIEQMQKFDLKKAEHITKTHGVKAELASEKGHPADQILKFSEKKGIDLIIIGNKGTGDLERFLLGSVCDTVVHHAKCAVLVVK